MQNKFERSLAAWTADQRIGAAKRCVQELTDRVIFVVDLNSANKFVQYSDVLSSQIPRSRAANAFNCLQEALFSQEVIRLLAIWDRPDENAVSIPQAISLIDEKGVVAKLAEQHFAAHSTELPRVLNPNEDPDLQRVIHDTLVLSQNDFALSQKNAAAKALQSCIETVKDTLSRHALESLKNYRDYQAHSLTRTRRDIRSRVTPAKYGEESDLLELSIRLIEDLYCWVNGTSFDIGRECREHSRRCAAEFWGNLTFDQ